MSLLPGFRRPQTWRAIEIAAKVRCPACKQVLSVPDGCAVETAKCPKCGQVIRLKPPARQPEPSAAVSPPPPPTATPPPPPPTSRPARPSRPPAHRRPAARPKRRSPWPWLAALGAVAALVAISLATGVFGPGGHAPSSTTQPAGQPSVVAPRPEGQKDHPKGQGETPPTPGQKEQGELVEFRGTLVVVTVGFKDGKSYGLICFRSEKPLPLGADYFGYDPAMHRVPNKYADVPTHTMKGLRGRILGTQRIERTHTSADGSTVLMLKDVEPLF